MHSARASLVVIAAGLLAAAAPGAASAQGWQQPGGSRGLLTPHGEYALLGGGVTDFTQSATRDRFDVGGTWDLRVGFGSRYFVGGEVAYVGSDRSGNGSGADLVQNGAEGVVRVQYPYLAGRWLLEPFVFGGLGWSHLSVRDAAPGMGKSDDIGVVPFGGGLTVGYGHVLLDARFTYRAAFDEDIAFSATDGVAGLDQWAVGASIGYEF